MGVVQILEWTNNISDKNNINSERVWGNNNLYDRKVQEIQNRRERFLLYTYIAWRIVSKDSGDV